MTWNKLFALTRSVNQEIADFFLVRAASPLTPRRFGEQKIDGISVWRSCLICITNCQSNRLLILLQRAEMVVRFSIANSIFNLKMDIDRHGPRRTIWLTTVHIFTHLIYRYQLPLTLYSVFLSLLSACQIKILVKKAALCSSHSFLKYKSVNLWSLVVLVLSSFNAEITCFWFD